MNTQDRIAEIIKNRYSNYAGQAHRKFIMIHAEMRTKIGDVAFLEHLEECERVNPLPKYEPNNLVTYFFADNKK